MENSPPIAEFWEGCMKSCAMVLMSEIGDKTFFIAAVMAMRNPRLPVSVLFSGNQRNPKSPSVSSALALRRWREQPVVLGGAFGALMAMTILSAAMGAVAPNLVSKFYTNLAAVCLFFFFGARLIYDSLQMAGDASWGELAEVDGME